MSFDEIFDRTAEVYIYFHNIQIYYIGPLPKKDLAQKEYYKYQQRSLQRWL